MVLIYGGNESTTKVTQKSSAVTTQNPPTDATVISDTTTIQTATTSLDPTTMSQPTSSTNSPEATTFGSSPSTTQKSEAITSTAQSSTTQQSVITTIASNIPTIQGLDDKTADLEDLITKGMEVLIEKSLNNEQKSVTEISQTTATVPNKNSEPQPDQTTTIKSEQIIPTPNTPIPFEATIKSQEIPFTMIISTSTESSTKFELIPTPQASNLLKRIQRSAENLITTSTLIAILTNSVPENLPTTTLVTTLATVPFREDDPTKKPENRFNFFEVSTPRGMDATTTTQQSLPTTSAGIETTTQVCDGKE